jgi:hypothetical protein
MNSYLDTASSHDGCPLFPYASRTGREKLYMEFRSSIRQVIIGERFLSEQFGNNGAESGAWS